MRAIRVCVCACVCTLVEVSRDVVGWVRVAVIEGTVEAASAVIKIGRKEAKERGYLGRWIRRRRCGHQHYPMPTHCFSSLLWWWVVLQCVIASAPPI